MGRLYGRRLSRRAARTHARTAQKPVLPGQRLRCYRKRRDGAVRGVAASIRAARYNRPSQLTRRLRAMLWPWRDSPAWLSRVARGYVEIEEPRWHCLCGQFQSYLLHETQGTARHTGVLFTPAIDPRNRQLNFLVACRDTNFTR